RRRFKSTTSQCAIDPPPALRRAGQIDAAANVAVPDVVIRTAAALMMFAATALAAEHPQRLSLIVSDPVQNEHTATGTTWSGELALEYSFGVTPRLSLDGRAGFERRLDYFYSLFRPDHPPGGTRALFWERRVDTRPWTLLATFRGEQRGRFTPRISGGLRHGRAPIAWYCG